MRVCSTCELLRKNYEDALARLRQTIQQFEEIEEPDVLDVEELEQHRLAFDRARRALDEHTAQHGTEN